MRLPSIRGSRAGAPGSSRTRLAVDRYFTHAPSRRPRRRCRALRDSQPDDVPLVVYGPAAEAIGVVTRPLSAARASRSRHPPPRSTCSTCPAIRAATSPISRRPGRATRRHVFCGDTLFSCGCGRLFEGTPAQMLASLDALAALPGDTHVHCAHEYTLSNIRFALACEPGNAALATWRDDAQGAARARARCPLRSRMSVPLTRSCGRTARRSARRSRPNCMKRCRIV